MAAATRLPTDVRVIRSDITALRVDAIVNAANTSLQGGGGVDGAIHRKAGPELAIAGRLLGGCKPGQAKITEGFRLPARYVIHTVGPVWQGGHSGEPGILASCYRESLGLAVAHGLRSVAFPAISTGIFGYPQDEAAQTAAKVVSDFVAEHPEAFDTIIFCAFDEPRARVIEKAVEEFRA